MPLVYIAIGSNIAPEENIPKALRMLARQVCITGVSTFYRTPAVDSLGSPDFINGVIQVRTEIPPRELKFGVLRPIESALGRRRSSDRNTARTIDLDILLYGDAVVREADLVIPDPDLAGRAFLAVPVLELDSDAAMPGANTRLDEEAGNMDTASMEPLPEFTERLRQEITSEPR